MSYEKDLEKSPDMALSYDKRPSIDETGAVPGETFEYGDSMRAKLMRLAGKFGVEQRGIERVTENERTESGNKALLNVGTMVGYLI